MKNLFLALTLFLFLPACTSDKASSESPAEEIPNEIADDLPKGEPDSDGPQFAPETADEATAEWISGLLVSEYVKEDLEYIEDNERVFQYFPVDLNNDEQNEYFVRFMNSWFCGSGGCTFFLLSAEGEMITKFTVTNPPIFVEPVKKNGWSVLLVKDRGEWKELTFENGSYPSNPTILDKAPYDAPSGHARVLFDEDFGKAKTWTF